jgi:hypothetical protein
VRSKLRRWRSCMNQSAQLVLMDSYMHSAWTRIVVIRFLNSDGNTDFANEGIDGQEFVATTSQGNYLSFHGGSGCLGLKFGWPIDGQDTGEEGESTTSSVGRIVLYRVWCLTLVSFREDHCKKTPPSDSARTNHEQQIMGKSEKQGVVYKFYNTDQANSCPNVNMVQHF